MGMRRQTFRTDAGRAKNAAKVDEKATPAARCPAKWVPGTRRRHSFRDFNSIDQRSGCSFDLNPSVRLHGKHGRRVEAAWMRLIVSRCGGKYIERWILAKAAAEN